MFGMTDDDDAIELLKRDHDEVETMFRQYEEIRDGATEAQKKDLVAQICDALTAHAKIEEQIFYPAARRALAQPQAKGLLDEAAVEHQTLKDIIGRLEAASPGDPLFDAGVKVLSEYVKHHVREEENELFPKVKSSDLDLDAVGRQLAERKRQLEGRRRTSRSGSRGRRSRSEDRAATGASPRAAH